MTGNGDHQYYRNITEHAIYAFLIATLTSQIQSKYNHNSSPYEEHYNLTVLFVASLLLYGAASVSEVELSCAQEGSTYLPLATCSRRFGCAVSLVVCLFILELIVLGWIVFTIWAAFFGRAAYDLRSWLHEALLVVGGFITGKWNNLVGLCNVTKDPHLFIPTVA